MSLLAAAVLSLSPAALGGAVSAEAGLEYDSNPNRVTGDLSDVIGSPLLRVRCGGLLQEQEGRHRLRLQLQAGGKIFFFPDAQPANIGAVQLDYEEGAQLGRGRIAGLLNYYDSYQESQDPNLAHDVRALGTGLRLGGHDRRGPGGAVTLDGWVDLTGQYFDYKPDVNYSFLGPALLYGGLFRAHRGDPELGHDFELALSGRLDYRDYSGVLQPAAGGSLETRHDGYVEAGLSGSWVGPVLLQVGYTLQLDVSSSPAYSYDRHLVLAKIAARLPGDLYLTAKTQLSFLFGAQETMQLASIDDEAHRSVALLDLERPLPRGVSLSARYTGYFNTPFPGANQTPYQRHTIYFGVSYRFKATRR